MEKDKKTDRIEFNLINNAKDSFNHAIDHLTDPDGIKPSDIKIAIREIAHIVELLLKERLSHTLRALVWENIDRYPVDDERTVDLDRAMARLSKISGITFNEEAIKTIRACKRIRNRIEHYEFSINTEEAKGIIGRLLSFIFEFSEKHLKVDWEKEIHSDDRWQALINIYQFWEAHGEAVERKLREENAHVVECPSCGAQTFEYDKAKCRLCEHEEPEAVCSVCGNTVWESEGNYQKFDGGGVSFVCNSCIDAQDAESYFINQAIDEARESGE